MQDYFPHNRMFNDIVFEGRNKGYGAYFLRHLYGRNMLAAIFLSMLFTLIVLNIPAAIRFLKGYLPEMEVMAGDHHIVYLGTPPTQAYVPPPAAKEPPAKKLSPGKQIQYTTPSIQPDDDVENDALVPSVSELITSNTGPASNKGEEGHTGDLNRNSTTSPGVIDTSGSTDFPVNFAEQMPEFIGGYTAMMQYLRKHLKYPALAVENNITGKVIVQFVVTAGGKIEDVRIMKGIGGGCDQEALRVIKEMPDWKPGRHNGRAVPVRFTLPISFELK